MEGGYAGGSCGVGASGDSRRDASDYSPGNSVNINRNNEDVPGRGNTSSSSNHALTSGGTGNNSGILVLGSNDSGGSFNINNRSLSGNGSLMMVPSSATHDGFARMLTYTNTAPSIIMSVSNPLYSNTLTFSGSTSGNNSVGGDKHHSHSSRSSSSNNNGFHHNRLHKSTNTSAYHSHHHHKHHHPYNSTSSHNQHSFVNNPISLANTSQAPVPFHLLHHSSSSSTRSGSSRRNTTTGQSYHHHHHYSSSSTTNSNHHPPNMVESLLDICAKVVAESVPFQRIEERYPRIPEPVQMRLVYWSFPRNESDIKMYSSFATLSGEMHGLPYHRGVRLLESGAVQDALQVGFHLSGTVLCNRGGNNNSSSSSVTNNSSTNGGNNNNNTNNNTQPVNNENNNNNNNNGPNNNVAVINNNNNNNNNNEDSPPQNQQQGNNNNNNNNNGGGNNNVNQPPATTNANNNNTNSNNNGNNCNGSGNGNNNNNNQGPNKYKVSISFDRCKITTVTCSCETRDIFWCPHAVALSLYRIRHCDSVQLRIPISETLLQMDRQQLQKLVQYLVSEHHTAVLPTAQRLADQILQPGHPINAIQGAPDPTAGNSADQEHCWHLDAEQVKQQVTHYLSQSPYCSPSRQLYYIFTKVREMIRARDSNGAKMLMMITEQFLNDPRLLLWKTQGTHMSDKCRHHWDAIASMWGCVVLSPHCSSDEKVSWSEALTKWANTSVCPTEDPDAIQQQSVASPARRSSRLQNSTDEDSSEDERPPRDRRDRRSSRRHTKRRRLCPPPPRSIFQHAIEACDLNWNHPHLQAILTGAIGTIPPPSSADDGKHHHKGSSKSGGGPSTLPRYYNKSRYSDVSAESSGRLLGEDNLDSCHRNAELLGSTSATIPCSFDASSTRYDASAIAGAGSQLRTRGDVMSQSKSSSKSSSGSSSHKGKSRKSSSSGTGMQRDFIQDHLTSTSYSKTGYGTAGPSGSFKPGSPCSSCTSSSLQQPCSSSSLLCSSSATSLPQPCSSSEFTCCEEPWCTAYSTSSPLQLPDFPSCTAFYNEIGQPLWIEPIPLACARVDALRSHGYKEAALRLAVVVARTLKHIQRQAGLWWTCKGRQEVAGRCTSTGWCCWLLPSSPAQQGWLGHTLDPITMLFDCLAEASVIEEDALRFQYHSDWLGLPNEDTASQMPLRFRHVPVPDSRDPWESYMTLALEVGLIGLGQHSIMAQGLYLQEKSLKQEEKLLLKMHELTLDGPLLHAVIRQAQVQLDGGPFSCLGEGIHPESVPVHTFAKYLFTSILSSNADLAYQVALRALRLPILEEQEETEDLLPPNNITDRYNFDRSSNNSANNNNDRNNPSVAAPSNNPAGGANNTSPNAERSLLLPRTGVGATRWFTLGHIETQQCGLACSVISAAANDVLRLRSVLDTALRNIHSSTHLFKLAQDAFRLATPPDGPRNTLLLNAALELGLQVLRLTLQCVTWRRREMVRWLVTCATEVGVAALMSIMQGWYALLTPPEAVAGLASTIMAHNTVLRLSLDRQQQDELAGVARTLALQCATKDPPNCALNALTLCEGDPASFEAAYQVVVDAATTSMSSSQLFSIAKYMEHRGHPQRAYSLALLAMQSVHITYTQDSHPAIADIHWAVSLAHSLGRHQLAQLLPVFVKNVQCATVLSDVLRRCTLTPPGGLSAGAGGNGAGGGGAAGASSVAAAAAAAAAAAVAASNGQGIHTAAAAVAAAGGLHDPSKRRKSLSLDKPPLRGLLDATILSYINTTNSRLTHISPRHYQDFIDFLTKAHETFMLAPDGHLQFAQLIENMKVAYKGKKKLMSLVRERFG